MTCDKNGTCDIVLSKEYNGKLVPTRGRECSSQQMPFVKKKFPSYDLFSEATVHDVLGEKAKEALHYQAQMFESVYMSNKSFNFTVGATSHDDFKAS